MKTLVKKGGKLRQQSDIKTSGWKKQPQFPFFIHFEHNIPSAWYVVLIVGAINRKMRRYGISGAESGNVGALIITRGKKEYNCFAVRPLLLHGEDQQQAAVRPLMNIVLSRIHPTASWSLDEPSTRERVWMNVHSGIYCPRILKLISLNSISREALIGEHAFVISTSNLLTWRMAWQPFWFGRDEARPG